MPASSQFGGELYTLQASKRLFSLFPINIAPLGSDCIIPFIIHILRKKTGLKKALIMVFRIIAIMEYLDRRYIEKSVKEEFDRSLKIRRNGMTQRMRSC